MSTEITTIKVGIETRIQATLSGFSEMNHGILVENNTKTSLNNKYVVIPDVIETNFNNGTLGWITVNQTYIVKLSKEFKQTQINDHDKQDVAIELMQKHCFDLYQDLVNNRAGATSIVINIDDMNIDTPDFIDNSVVVSMSFIVTYRKKLC